MAQDDSSKILEDLGSIPTAPFYEHGVMRYVMESLRLWQVPFKLDKWGNSIASFQRGKNKQRLAFVAHMDHPAIEIINENTARLLGGIKLSYFKDKKVPIILYLINGAYATSGFLLNPQKGETKNQIQFSFESEKVISSGFGNWLMVPGFHRDRYRPDIIRMRAADDFVGVTSMLNLLKTLSENDDIDCDVSCIFTRAEEMGGIGATLVAESKILPLDTMVISIEASKALPGAEIGDGVIIRTGDAKSVFSNESNALMIKTARELREIDFAFSFQRQLMSGGTCEASAFAVFGYTVGAIAVPLGNYHNMSPAGFLTPEFIKESDFLNVQKFLLELVSVAHDYNGQDVLEKFKIDLMDISRKNSDRLR